MGIERRGEKYQILRILQRKNPRDLVTGFEEARGIIEEKKVDWQKAVDTINGS